MEMAVSSCINLFLVSKQMHEVSKSRLLTHNLPGISVDIETTKPEELKQIAHMVPRESWHTIKGSIRILNAEPWQPESWAHAEAVMGLIEDALHKAGVDLEQEVTYSINNDLHVD
jgi:hypothetical protein